MSLQVPYLSKSGDLGERPVDAENFRRRAKGVVLVTGGLASDVGLLGALREMSEESGGKLELRVHERTEELASTVARLEEQGVTGLLQKVCREGEGGLVEVGKEVSARGGKCVRPMVC